MSKSLQYNWWSATICKMNDLRSACELMRKIIEYLERSNRSPYKGVSAFIGAYLTAGFSYAILLTKHPSELLMASARVCGCRSKSPRRRTEIRKCSEIKAGVDRNQPDTPLRARRFITKYYPWETRQSNGDYRRGLLTARSPFSSRVSRERLERLKNFTCASKFLFIAPLKLAYANRKRHRKAATSVAVSLKERGTNRSATHSIQNEVVTVAAMCHRKYMIILKTWKRMFHWFINYFTDLFNYAT